MDGNRPKEGNKGILGLGKSKNIKTGEEQRNKDVRTGESMGTLGLGKSKVTREVRIGFWIYALCG